MLNRIENELPLEEGQIYLTRYWYEEKWQEPVAVGSDLQKLWKAYQEGVVKEYHCGDCGRTPKQCQRSACKEWEHGLRMGAELYDESFYDSLTTIDFLKPRVKGEEEDD